MSADYLFNGQRSIVASQPQDGLEENAVGVCIDGGKIVWVLRFKALLGQNRVFIGAVRIYPSSLHRLVAILCVPGAKAFEVEGQGVDDTRDNLRVHFEGIPAKGGPWGVTPILGNSVKSARSYRVAAGVAGVVNIEGEVLGWSAHATAAAGQVVIAALPNLAIGPIPVPAGATIRGHAESLLAPNSIWNFINTDYYMVEYVPPGIEFDG